MCYCVHWEAIDLYELFGELVEDEVFLTTEETLKEWQWLRLLLNFGFRVLFPGHRALPFSSFVCSMSILTFCLCIRRFCVRRTQRVCFELFHRFVDLDPLQVDCLVITGRRMVLDWQLHRHQLFVLQNHRFVFIYFLQRYQLTLLCWILICWVGVFPGWIWAFVFCEILEHCQFLRSLKILQIRCRRDLACFAIRECLTTQDELLLLGRQLDYSHLTLGGSIHFSNQRWFWCRAQFILHFFHCFWEFWLNWAWYIIFIETLFLLWHFGVSELWHV